MCRYTNPVCPMCETKSRTVIKSCFEYKTSIGCPNLMEQEDMFAFCKKCREKLLSKYRFDCPKQLTFINSLVPMSLNEVAALIGPICTDASRCREI